MVEIRKLGTEKYLAPVRSYQNADDVKPNAFNVPRVRFHGGDQEDHDATDVCAEAEDSDDPDVLLKRYDSLKKNKVFGPQHDKCKANIQRAYYKWHDEGADKRYKDHQKESNKKMRERLNEIVDPSDQAKLKIAKQPKIDYEHNPFTIQKEGDVQIITAGRGWDDTKFVRINLDATQSVSPQREKVMTRNKLSKNLLPDYQEEEVSNNDNSVKATQILVKEGHKSIFYSNLA